MFRSTVLQLTAWYALGIMVLSLAFSVGLYQLAGHEVDSRLRHFAANLTGSSNENVTTPVLTTLPAGVPPNGFDDPMTVGDYRTAEVNSSDQHVLVELIWLNVGILVAGTLGSYFLARRTLKPIEEAHHAQSRFTSDASHELRTPLATMKLELEAALKSGELSKEEVDEILASNLEEVEKLTALVSMLLDLSRLDNDAKKLQFQRVDFSTVVRGAIEDQHTPAGRIKEVISQNLDVAGDSVALRQLVMVLLDNAQKYSPADSIITVTAKRQPKQVVLSVANPGKPIPEESLPHLFDRFYRVDTARTTSAREGYGLGLSIAKKIVDLHQGEISVKSDKRTTVFTVILPILR